MKFIACIQGSPEWYAARCGLVTASRMSDVMARIKTGEAAGRRNYRSELVAEILTGQPYDTYVNADMQRGTELEPLARAAYEVSREVMVDHVGFVVHGAISRSGASPDGIVGTQGLCEIKVPKTATHIGYILGDLVPSEYKDQMLWQMECCERQWCDFVSYDPRMPEHLQLFVKRLERNETRMVELRLEVEKFILEIDDVLARLPKGPLHTLEQQLEVSLAEIQKVSGASEQVTSPAPSPMSPLTKSSTMQGGDEETITLETGEIVKVQIQFEQDLCRALWLGGLPETEEEIRAAEAENLREEQ